MQQLMKAILLSTLFGVFSLASAAHKPDEFYAQLEAPSQKIKDTIPVVHITAAGVPGGGSGVVLEHQVEGKTCKTLVLTAWHVAKVGRVKYINGREAFVVAVWAENDLALMETTTCLPNDTASLWPEDEPLPGHGLLAWASGYGLSMYDPVLTQVVISGWNDNPTRGGCDTTEMTNSNPCWSEPMLQLGGNLIPGMSGGGVFYQGSLIGIVQLASKYSSMGWAAPVWLIRDFLAMPRESLRVFKSNDDSFIPEH